MDQLHAVKLLGLTNAELLDLQKEIGKEQIKQQQKGLQVGEHGALDPVTATVVVSGWAILALAIWLNKNRRRGEIRQQVEIQDATGAKVKQITVVVLEDEQSDAEVVNAMARAFEVDPAGLLGKTQT